MTEATPPAITGYRTLTPDQIAAVNMLKATANSVGTMVDACAASGEFDPRWLAIARTHLQEGFMALTRAFTKPEGF